ncbi:MAG: hypothetical protein KF900_00725 [Bacteroidetes bacterium]|nr:hypothetical protein [Bacteroidota bacterium]
MNAFRKYFFVLMLLASFIGKTQNSNINHLVGIDLGYSFYPKEVGYKGEANLNYFLAHKHFAAKVGGGIAPFTNYGAISKYYAGLGLTTEFNQYNTACYLLFGLGFSKGSKSIFEGINGYGAPYYSSLYGGFFYTDMGFYHRIKQSNLYLGSHVTLSYGEDSPFISINVSVNYKLKNTNDTVSKVEKITHFFGVGLGYSSYPKIAGYKGEIGLNYFFTYKYLALNLAASVASATHFGVVTKFPVQIGFTTKAYKKLSWHLLAGLTFGGTSKEKYFTDTNNYKTFSPIGLSASTGVYHRINQSNFLLGVHVTVANCIVGEPKGRNNTTYQSNDNIPYAQINVSLNYKLNSKKHEN